MDNLINQYTDRLVTEAAHRSLGALSSIGRNIGSGRSFFSDTSMPTVKRSNQGKRKAQSWSGPTPKRVAEVKRHNRRMGASGSKSAGFLKMRRQKAKKRLKGASAFKGIHGTFEHGAVLTALDCLYAGHATAPRDVIMSIVFQSMLKQLMKIMGCRIENMTDDMTAAPYFFGAGDAFSLRYYTDAQTTTLSSNTFTIGAGATFKSVADGLANQIFSGVIYNQIQPVDLRYQTASAEYQPARLDLRYTYFSIYMKSSMKIQNRTINATGNDEADDVDNVPLYGKSIGGNGTGCQMLFSNTAATPAQIVCDLANGTIDRTTLGNNLKEPLSGVFFPKSTKQGKIKLDPGEIKTHVLTFRKNITLQTLFRLFWRTGAVPVIVPFGNFAFFQLEKMIDSGSALNITVAYETNLEYNCVCVPKYNFATSPQYAKF